MTNGELYTEVDEISPELIKALLIKEDRFFFYHPGINPIALVRAVFNNVIKGRRTSGASTITMQVARLKEPKARTISSKVKEMFRSNSIRIALFKKRNLAAIR